MNDGIEGRDTRTELELIQASIRSERIEHLPRIRDVGDEIIDVGVSERHYVEVDDSISIFEKVSDRVLSGLAGAASEKDSFCAHSSFVAVKADLVGRSFHGHRLEHVKNVGCLGVVTESVVVES